MRFKGLTKIKYYPLFATLFFASCSETNHKIPVQEKDFCSEIHLNGTASLTKEFEDISSLMNEKTGVYVLEDGGGSLITRAWLCESAEKTIGIQYFIFSTDNVGLIACDYMVRAADRGVKVRIIVDDILIAAEIDDLLTLDSHENITLKIFNPGINLGKSIFSKIRTYATDFRSANIRMHNKTFNVDGKAVITGGRNVADEYFDYDHDYYFRDRDVLLLGKAVEDVSRSFEQFWDDSMSVHVTDLVVKEKKKDVIKSYDSTRFDNLHQYACNPDNFWPQIRTKIENFPAIFREIKNSGDIVWSDSVFFVSDLPEKNDGSYGFAGGGFQHLN